MLNALEDLNSAVLDLQSSEYQTYQRPLKRLNSILHSDELSQITNDLKSDVDLEEFLSSATREGGMVGGGRLNWPGNRTKELGLEIKIIEKAAGDPRWFLGFAHEYYYGGSTKINADLRNIISSLIIPFNRDFQKHVKSKAPNIPVNKINSNNSNRVFIVHGHEEAPRESVARFLEKLSFDPVILHEQANEGLTIPEKLSAYSSVGFAVVLLTPDDRGRSIEEEEERPRARQNVILELGYFIGLLGRGRVCALKKGNIEIPSDYLNVGYHPYDSGGAWKQSLARELKAAGYEIDWNIVMS